MNAAIHHGNCLDVLRGMPDNSVDAIVTDPPYGLSNTSPDKVAETIVAWASGDREAAPSTKSGFMGAEWDAFVPPPAVWDECFRVLKPGGHIAAFAGSRTQDLMGLSIRLAGFDIRDSVAWLYGSGFPKSLDVSKAIDKAARGHPQGAADPTSPNHGKYRTSKTEGKRWNGDSGQSYGAGGSTFLRSSQTGTASEKTTAPSTRATTAPIAAAAESTPTNTLGATAEKWQGWGTALKPGHEPIILARKPFPGTVAANVQGHGTGAINIDKTRIGLGDEKPPAGRWPANVILDPDTAKTLDQQSGIRQAGRFPGRQNVEGGLQDTPMRLGWKGQVAPEREMDEGGASRFFKVVEPDPPFLYAAKAPKRERPSYTTEDGQTVQHATVKPLSIMQWLVKLVTPVGGTVLDPFAGSGTTVEAAILEGFNVIGIEREAEYLPLIQQRIDRATPADPESTETTLLDLIQGDAA